jgi:hypothetical protein
MYVVLQYSLIGGFGHFGFASCAPEWVVILNMGVTKLEEKWTFFTGFPDFFGEKLNQVLKNKGYCVARKLAITGCKVKQVALRINSFDSQL